MCEAVDADGPVRPKHNPGIVQNYRFHVLYAHCILYHKELGPRFSLITRIITPKDGGNGFPALVNPVGPSELFPGLALAQSYFRAIPRLSRSIVNPDIAELGAEVPVADHYFLLQGMDVETNNIPYFLAIS